MSNQSPEPEGPTSVVVRSPIPPAWSEPASAAADSPTRAEAAPSRASEPAVDPLLAQLQVEEFELRTNNATLTGESEPVRKTASPHDDPNLTLIEMPNLVFAGTSVAYGGGKAIVFATAMQTQFGKIANAAQDALNP